MLNEQQAIELAATPEKIIHPDDCNIVIGYLNGYITDLGLKEFELELVANQHKVDLLNTEGKRVALAEAEWKVSEPYKNWRRALNELRKFRAWRNTLRSKEKTL